ARRRRRPRMPRIGRPWRSVWAGRLRPALVGGWGVTGVRGDTAFMSDATTAGSYDARPRRAMNGTDQKRESVPIADTAARPATLAALRDETGTWRPPFTQAMPRGRWLAAKTSLLATPVPALTTAFAAVFSWYRALLDRPQRRFGLNSYDFKSVAAGLHPAGLRDRGAGRRAAGLAIAAAIADVYYCVSTDGNSSASAYIFGVGDYLVGFTVGGCAVAWVARRTRAAVRARRTSRPCSPHSTTATPTSAPPAPAPTP